MRVNGAITSRLGRLSGPSGNGSNSAGRFICSDPFERDAADVDIHQQRFRYQHIVAFVGVDPPFGKELQSIDLAISVGVVESRGTAQDVNGVVVTSQQPIRTETRNLFLGMALDAIGKNDFESPPALTIDVDRGDLFGDEVRLRIQKG